jgi:hypothetical protein
MAESKEAMNSSAVAARADSTSSNAKQMPKNRRIMSPPRLRFSLKRVAMFRVAAL